MTILYPIFFLLFSLNTYSQSALPFEVLPIDDPHLYTIHGVAQSFLISPNDFETFKNNKITKKKFYFYNKEIKKKVAINYFSPRNKVSNKLVVIFPGIFDNAHSGNAIKLAELIASENKNVIIIPNSLTKDFFKLTARFGVDIVKNSQLLTMILKKILTIIPETKSVHFFGHSYGSFIAAITSFYWSMDQSLPRINGVTISSPPVDIVRSVGLIDKSVEATKSQTIACTPYLNNPLKLLQILSQSNKYEENDYGPIVQACSKFIFFNTFSNNLQGYLKDIDAPFKDKNKIVSFQEYVGQAISPYIIKSYQKNGMIKIINWLKEIDQKNISINVIASMDDPINGNAQQLISEFPGNKTLFPRGGHGGLWAHKEFFEFLLEKLH